MIASDEQEILDIVNDRDEVIGVIGRSDMMSLKKYPGRYLRCVEIFIQRPNGDIYLPRRSTQKKIAPGGLDVSVAGHVLHGETYEQACIREVLEEANIAITIDEIILIQKFVPSADLFYFRALYLLRSKKLPTLSPEHIEALWIPPDKLGQTVNNDIPTKEALYDDIPVLLDFLRNDK